METVNTGIMFIIMAVIMFITGYICGKWED